MYLFKLHFELTKNIILRKKEISKKTKRESGENPRFGVQNE